MPQSNVIFFYVFAAFFVFITLRGELPKYMGFLLASPTGGKTPLSGQVTRGADLSDLSNPAFKNANNTSPDWARIGQIAALV